jgi:hypothetical protein
VSHRFSSKWTWFSNHTVILGVCVCDASFGSLVLSLSGCEINLHLVLLTRGVESIDVVGNF